MMNKWEARERQTKRIALIVSVVLHVAIIVGVTQIGGENKDQETEQAKDHSTDHVKADTKV